MSKWFIWRQNQQRIRAHYRPGACMGRLTGEFTISRTSKKCSGLLPKFTQLFRESSTTYCPNFTKIHRRLFLLIWKQTDVVWIKSECTCECRQFRCREIGRWHKRVALQRRRSTPEHDKMYRDHEPVNDHHQHCHQRHRHHHHHHHRFINHHRPLNLPSTTRPSLKVSSNIFAQRTRQTSLHLLWTLAYDLDLWAPCALVHKAFSGQGSNLSPGASAYQKIISNNSYAHNEQGDNPDRIKEGLMVSSIKCDRCWHLD